MPCTPCAAGIAFVAITVVQVDDTRRVVVQLGMTRHEVTRKDSTFVEESPAPTSTWFLSLSSL
jgi:hypothetical protein